MSDALYFFRSFLRDPRHVGSVWPSSRCLAKALVGGMRFFAGDLVLEYGPGTGAVTSFLDQVLPTDVEYLGIELNEDFVLRLCKKFPARRFVYGSVADVEQILGEEGLGSPKLIISGLPFASLPCEQRKKIIDSTARVLHEDGQFRTFQYMHAFPMRKASEFRKSMEQRFRALRRSAPVIRNLPPAYVLSYVHSNS